MARRDGWSGLFGAAFKGSRNAMALVDEKRVNVDVNGAWLALLGYKRNDLIGHPVYEFIVGGPLMSDREWLASISRGDYRGEAPLRRADGSEVTVQFAAHPEVVTGRRLILFVALSTSRWGRHSRRAAGHEPEGSELSPREHEVVRLVALGETGPEIAGELHISHQTVRTHVRNAMEKLGARSRAQLVAKALAEGVVLS
jgi:PAS domain S-box-containing protein